MASYEKITNLVDLPVSFSPKTAFPLDSRSMFGSKAEADAAAATAENAGSSNTVYYIGQTITVFENDNVNFYQIQANKTLKEVGTAPVGDDKSISVGDGGVVSIKSYGVEYYKYNAADIIIDNSAGTYTANNLPKGAADGSYVKVGETWYKYTESSKSWATVTTAPKTSSSYTKTTGWKAGLEPRVVADGDNGTAIAWYEPSTETLEGLSTAINTLDAAVSQNSDSISAVEKRATNLESEVGINSSGVATGSGLLKDVSTLKSTTEALASDVNHNTTAIGVSTSGSETGLYKEIKDLKAADAATNKAISDAKTELNTAIDKKANKATTLAGYGITDAFTKDETNSAISKAVADAAHLKYTIKAKKDDIDITAADADQYIYLVPKTTGKTDDGYDEYMVIDVSGIKNLEKVGDWDMDLSGYATTEALNTALSAYKIKTANATDFTVSDAGQISLNTIAQSKIKDLDTTLTGKEDKSNKSNNITSDSANETTAKTKYPSVYAVKQELDKKLNTTDNLITKLSNTGADVVGMYQGDTLSFGKSSNSMISELSHLSIQRNNTGGMALDSDGNITFASAPADGLWSNIATVDGEVTTTLKNSLDKKVDTTSDKLLTDDQKNILGSFKYTNTNDVITLATNVMTLDTSLSNVNAGHITSAGIEVNASSEAKLFSNIEGTYKDSTGASKTKDLQTVLDSKVGTNSDKLLTADQKAAITALGYTNAGGSTMLVLQADINTSKGITTESVTTKTLTSDSSVTDFSYIKQTAGDNLQQVLDNLVKKDGNKVLSTNDYTANDKKKVDKLSIYSGTNTALKDAITIPGALGASFSKIIDPDTGTKLSDAIADSNVIESVKVGGTALTIDKKAVNIPVGSASALGVVKSSAAKDRVTINSDGTMTVNSYNAIKLYVDDTDTLTING